MDCYSHIVKTYDSRAGFANLYYRHTRVHITYETSWIDIMNALKTLSKTAGVAERA